MAITYPRAFPTGLRFGKSQMALTRQMSTITLESGAVQAAEMGEPIWRLSATTEPLRWTGRRQLAAWHASLAGSRRILAYDWVGSYPIAYGAAVMGLTRATGGAFGGSATLTSWTAITVTLTGLPAGYVLSAGDRMSWAWAGVRAYHEAVEPVTASASGVATVTVEPGVRLSPAPAAGSAVALVRPTVVMMIVPDSWSLDESGALGAASFEAVQVVV
ncbi:hypothetical protein V5F38_04235 [Xanthobacter sp. V0B-10]|uniref:hypothetical protein n=1 Tax=Xanthobacter albus TaxID=3119929 RepID=UPI00372B972E